MAKILNEIDKMNDKSTSLIDQPFNIKKEETFTTARIAVF
jgi:hypothetical protein